MKALIFVHNLNSRPLPLEHQRGSGHHDDCAGCSSALCHHQLVCSQHKSAVQEESRWTGISVFKETVN